MHSEQKHPRSDVCPFQCVILDGTWCQQVSLLLKLTLITCLKQCLSDFFHFKVIFHFLITTYLVENTLRLHNYIVSQHTFKHPLMDLTCKCYYRGTDTWWFFISIILYTLINRKRLPLITQHTWEASIVLNRKIGMIFMKVRKTRMYYHLTLFYKHTSHVQSKEAKWIYMIILFSDYMIYIWKTEEFQLKFYYKWEKYLVMELLIQLI